MLKLPKENHITLPAMLHIIQDQRTAGIYLHIPFCRQACVYCNFHFSTTLKYKNELLRAMEMEIAIQSNYLKGAQITTVYFGGGTPSLLTANEINRLLDCLSQHYNITQLTECTLEANPEDLNKNYIQTLKKTAVNRLSIGVQSFKDEDLQFMNRKHNAVDAENCIKTAQDAGFSNLSIDLIYGTPNLKDSEWNTHLSKINELNIPHFSAYALTVEEKTALFSAIQKKKKPPVDVEQAAAQFELLMQFAEDTGYEHYEISNLAKPGKHAIHNTNYWLGNHYLGIGPSAHSYNGNSRKWNVANNILYIDNLQNNNKLIFDEETLTTAQCINEYIMTSLRTIWGCDLQYISGKWGRDISSAVEKQCANCIENKLIINENNKLILTKPGKLLADRIASELFL